MESRYLKFVVLHLFAKKQQAQGIVYLLQFFVWASFQFQNFQFYITGARRNIRDASECGRQMAGYFIQSNITEV